ncbi:cobalamin B12-binding domain-containing protein [Saccharopolyspora spinosa]|uniref:Methylaspartate mutase sigma subunit/methylaspartate mutase epsilon subunit n=1 Tax=Saccharopolyspora spinosa TaxID=60894 RepID=A0A2N3Y1G0_SACSN|nr:cobalamin-dependent protein [Saccharopolyspora spinosa]PKW16747.1 methylaspartate mutase sigma subunit/methylaspartate mutase epsilon subunit [Saccharopolyspora spinosa]
MREITPSLPRVLLSTISSDSHTWNLVFLQLLLEEGGNEVINLGPCVPDELLLESARKHEPDAIVISTVNGHGHIDGSRLIKKLRSVPGLRDVPTIIGGKLGIRGAENSMYTESLLKAGYTAVFTDSREPSLLNDRIAELVSGARQAIGAIG